MFNNMEKVVKCKKCNLYFGHSEKKTECPFCKTVYSEVEEKARDKRWTAKTRK